jgi:hypothetical protein
MSHHAAAPFLEAKIAVAFYTTAAVAIGVGLVRAEGLGPGLIFGCLPLLALGYSLYGRSLLHGRGARQPTGIVLYGLS